MLSLLLDQDLEIVLVIEDLLAVFLHRCNELLILLIPLLKGDVLLLKWSNLDLNLPQLLVSLCQQLLQLEDLILCLSF